MHTLLILGCSQKKRDDTKLLPAVERYDGPAFRVLKRFIRENGKHVPEVYVLSAEFGLTNSQLAIPNYDRKMTSQRARGLRPQVTDVLSEVLRTSRWTEVGICVIDPCKANDRVHRGSSA